MSPVAACFSFAPLRASFFFFFAQLLLGLAAAVTVVAKSRVRTRGSLAGALCDGVSFALVLAWVAVVVLAS